MINFDVLETAKQKMLQGDFSLAASYYGRARSEGVADSVVDIRYLTKNYLVYPIEYENSTEFFEILKKLKQLAENNSEYKKEYIMALKALIDIRRLFVRSLSLFYFSDIEVCRRDSIVVFQIGELYTYISKNIKSIAADDCYEIRRYLPATDFEKLNRDLEIVEIYCLNLLLSYTGVQQSTYTGKRYSAFTLDYGYFASTYVKSHDTYSNCATMQPRMFLLNLEAYYEDSEKVFKHKMKKLKFNSPVELKKELTYYIKKKCKKNPEERDFLAYSKHFEKQDYARQSYISILNTYNIWGRLNLTTLLYDKNSVGSFELDVYFPRKKIWGVCDMLSVGHGWSLDTVRWCMMALSCLAGMGFFVYLGLAIMKKLNIYPNVHIKKH